MKEENQVILPPSPFLIPKKHPTKVWAEFSAPENQSRARFELAGCQCTPRRQSEAFQKTDEVLVRDFGALPLSYNAIS